MPYHAITVNDVRLDYSIFVCPKEAQMDLTLFLTLTLTLTLTRTLQHNPNSDPDPDPNPNSYHKPDRDL